jgi:hypothetical protein
MTAALFSQKSRMLLRFQRKNLIESQSSSCDSDDQKFETLKLMDHKNPYIRLIIFGKMKKMLMSYADKKLKTLDKNLIRGIYLRHIKDFEEENN